MTQHSKFSEAALEQAIIELLGQEDYPCVKGDMIFREPGQVLLHADLRAFLARQYAAGPDAGIIEYRVDQGPWQEQDLFTQWSSGLHIPWLHILAAELDSGKDHTLQVRISGKNHPESTGHACRVVHLAINRGE